MARLSAEQKKKLSWWMQNYPEKADEIVAALEADGYEIERAEFEPVDWGAEADAAIRGGIKGLTLGAVDPGPPRYPEDLGDVDLPLVGEVQPSALIGQLAGMFTPGVGPGTLALKAGRGLIKGAPKAARAAATAAGETAPATLARGAAQEGVAGGLIGAGQSVGEGISGTAPEGESFVGRTLESMVMDAAAFASIGLIGRGVLRLFRGAAAKEASGETLSAAEQDAAKQVTDLVVQRQPIYKGRQLPPSTEGGEPIYAGSGQRQLDIGRRGPRERLPESSASGPVITNPWMDPKQIAPTIRGPREQLPPSTQGSGSIRIFPQNKELPRFTGETAASIGGKPPEVIRLEASARELYSRVERGEINSVEAMQAFQLMIDKGVPFRERALVGHRAREAFRKAEGLDENAGAPVTRDPQEPPPAAPGAPLDVKPAPPPKKVGDPKKPRPMPSELSPFQAMRRGGGLRSDTVDRLYRDLPVESGGARASLGKLRGGGQDVESLLQDIRDGGGPLAHVLDRAGIHTHDDVAKAVQDGSFFKKQSTKQEKTLVDEIFEDRPLDYDPSMEGFETRVPHARSIDALEEEMTRLHDAAEAGEVTHDQVAEITRLISAKGNDLYDQPSKPRLDLEPTAPTGRPPRPVEENMPLDLGDKRTLPGLKRTSGTERLEDTPLAESVEGQRRAAAQAAAPQGEMEWGGTQRVVTPNGEMGVVIGQRGKNALDVDLGNGTIKTFFADQLKPARGGAAPQEQLFSGAFDVIPEGSGETFGRLRLGDNVLFEMQDGSQKVGTLSIQEAPNTITLRAGGRKYHVNAADIRTASKIHGGRGGADDISGAASDAQQRKLFAMENDLKRMGSDEKIGGNPAQMTKNEAARRINEMELARTELSERHLGGMVDELDEIASDPKGKRMDGGDLSDLPDQALVEEFGPDVFKDVTWAYGKYLLPEISKFGLLRNPIGKLIVERGLQTVRNVNKEASQFLERYAQITKGLSRGQKFRIVKALDDSPDALKDTPDLMPAYQEMRKMFDEMADRLGLEKGQKIRHYFPHIFSGPMGRWRAITLGRELGTGTSRRLAAKADQLDLSGGRFDVQAGIPLQKFFANVLKRDGVDGFDMDLDKAVYSYVTGAVRKIHYDSYLKFSLDKLRQIPTHDTSGRFPMAIRRYLAEHIAHAVGQPTSGRVSVARFFHDANRFNAGVDRLVESIGGAPERGLLKKARRMGELNTKARLGQLTPEEKVEWASQTPAEAMEWLGELTEQAQKYRDGVRADTPRMKRWRAEAALAINDLRGAMSDPFRRGLIAEHAYRWMVISKLGLNFSHGIINMTQFLTNVVPKLDVRYAARGVRNNFLARGDQPLLGGRTRDSILDDLAVLHDTPKASEFVPQRFGPTARLQDVAMTPARLSEKYMRGSAGLGAYEQHLAKQGVKSGQRATRQQHEAAIEWARGIVDETLFPFNRVGTPKALRSPGMRLLLMFQSYPIHQMNFSAQLIGDVFTNPTSSEAWGALTKHAMAYLALYGTAQAVGENFWARTQHPAADVAELVSGEDRGYNQDVFDLVSGPLATALIQAMHGNFESAQGQLEPTIVKRARTADNVDELLLGTLLQDRRRPARGGTQGTTGTR